MQEITYNLPSTSRSRFTIAIDVKESLVTSASPARLRLPDSSSRSYETTAVISYAYSDYKLNRAYAPSQVEHSTREKIAAR